MPRRVPLDPSLALAPFTTAQGRAAGHTQDRLDGPDLLRPFHGVRSTRSSGIASLYAPLLRPGDRFSHTTAAELWGVPLPAALEGQLHVTAGAGLQRPRGRGVIGHEGMVARPVLRSGLPVSDPLATFRELAPLLSLADLVAAGDHLVLNPRVLDPLDLRPYVELDMLRRELERVRGRGIRAARAAADLVRAGVESRRETHLRLLLVAAGVPEPVCGYELVGIGWFDLAWPEFRVIAEYDGDQHRSSTQQYERDIRRFDLAADAGWRVVRVRKRGIQLDRSDTVQRVISALRRAGWTPSRRISG